MTRGMAMAERGYEGDSLSGAQDWLRERVESGASCPCCTQYAKVYRRRLTSVGARTMIRMWRESEGGWVHVPTLLKNQLPGIAHQGGYATLGQHWQLIAESPEEREDGGRVGWWRLTRLGESFVHCETTISKYVRIYDGRCLSLSGSPVSIVDALGTKFDYGELMDR